MKQKTKCLFKNSPVKGICLSFVLLTAGFIFSTGCFAKKKVKLECGCIEKNSRDILFTATMRTDNPSTIASIFSILSELERNRDIYGLCSTTSRGNSEFVFCTDDDRIIQDEIENRYPDDVSIREEDGR